MATRVPAGFQTCAIGALLVAIVSCHASVRTARPSSPKSPAASPTDRSDAAVIGGSERSLGPATRDLGLTIDAALADPALAHGYWGVLVRSLRSGDTLYERNAARLLMPASNMKLLTLAAAVDGLGWDFTYETRVLAAGTIADGRLDGDLVVVGSGDPAIGVADGMSDRLFADWATRLKEAGIRTIAGRIVGDDKAFDDDGLGFGWSWDDLADDYAAAVSALQFNENAVRVTVAPGLAVGDAAGVSAAPATAALVVDNELKTGAPGGPPSIVARRLPGSARLELRGSVPLGSAPVTRVVSVDNPTLFFASALRTALIAHGIDVRGPAVDMDETIDPPVAAERTPIVSYRSAPLSTLAVRLMKVSQNLYAETLLKTVGAHAGAGTFTAGRIAADAALQKWGLQPGDFIERDGSGLSRYDFVTPAALVAILTHVDRDERLRGPFEASLPIAGRDGTLANRMKGTPAEGNVRAKTGSMANVRALSGYVTTADGEPLVFSIIANNFETSADVIIKATDTIVVKLAAFRR